MAWDTAIYTGASIVNGQQCVNVQISDSGNSARSIVKQYFPSPSANNAWLAAQVLNDVTSLNSVNTFVDDLTLNSAISLISPASPTPTAQSTFLANYSLLLTLNAAKAAGVTNIDTSALIATLNSTYQESYFGTPQ